MIRPAKLVLVLALGFAPTLAPIGTVQTAKGAAARGWREQGNQRAANRGPADAASPNGAALAYVGDARPMAHPRARIDWRIACVMLAGVYLVFAALLRALFARSGNSQASITSSAGS